jgi:hypothetical protein
MFIKAEQRLRANGRQTCMIQTHVSPLALEDPFVVEQRQSRRGLVPRFQELCVVRVP